MTFVRSENEGATSIDDGQRRRLETRRGVLKSVGGSAGARLLVLPFSAILGIVVTRLILDNYGEATYAQYILLVGIAAMIPFADLGITAAIMNAVAGAENPRHNAYLQGVLISCMRILASCATVVTLVALIIYATGSWELLLGGGLSLASGSLAATLCLIVFAVNLLVSFGQRILIALGLNFVVVFLNGLQTPIVLLILWIVLSTGMSGGLIAVASYGATTLISIACLLIAAHKVRPMLGTSLRAALNPKQRGEQVFNTAWPMLIQMIALPLAMSSDRLVLSHLGTLTQLTEYSLAAQMFTPIFAVVAAAGMSLWPVFARARTSGTASPFTPFTMSVGFTLMALLASVAMCLVSPWLADVASGGQITIGLPVLIAFSILIVVQSAKYPYGMYLTDASGLRFQAYFILVMLPLNLGLTILLTPTFGAVGPLIGSIVGVVTCQLIPNALMVRRRTRDSQPATALRR